MKPVIALVGRPNVGKSTLFNRLTRTRDALVADYPGLTRDRKYGDGRLGDYLYTVVDTGGIGENDDGIDAPMTEQSLMAVGEADLVLFMVDGRAGLTAADEQIATELRKLPKPTYLVVNKTDGIDPDTAMADFYALGLNEVLPIAAAHGRGVRSMIETVLEAFPDLEPYYDEQGEPVDTNDGSIRVAVLGRPNVGKSTLINRMLGEERVVVFDHAGTTRDSIEIPFERMDKAYTLIDTAGIRRRSKVNAGAERFAVIRAFDAAERSDVVLLTLDATRGVADQDLRIAELVLDRGRSLAILVNKWDLVDDGRELLSDVRHRLRFADFSPLLTVSAATGRGCSKILSLASRLRTEQRRRIPTGELNRRLKVWYDAHHPPSWRGRHVRFYYASQVGISPPTFLFSVSAAKGVRPAYRRYLTNRLRAEFGFDGSALALKFKTHREDRDPGRGKRRPKKRRAKG